MMLLTANTDIDKEPDLSIIIPVRNEAGNIEMALYSIPDFDCEVEVIFVYGESDDGTWRILEEHISNYTGKHQIIALQQTTIGKWEAVQEGFDVARGRVLIILDGDLTVDPSELIEFYKEAAPGLFVIGARMIHPMQSGAMSIVNIAGNIFFATLCSIVIRHAITDSLCGTKMLMRDDWLRMKDGFPDLIKKDPFGDHVMLYGASRLGLTIKEIPVHYLARRYGQSKIKRFSDGWKLLKLGIWELRQINFRKH